MALELAWYCRPLSAHSFRAISTRRRRPLDQLLPSPPDRPITAAAAGTPGRRLLTRRGLRHVAADHGVSPAPARPDHPAAAIAAAPAPPVRGDTEPAPLLQRQVIEAPFARFMRLRHLPAWDLPLLARLTRC